MATESRYKVFLICLSPCACVCVLKLCMCVLILVAATRSYSRSTGALHTPDTFGAAGEGWVLTFVCTSPTHHFAFNYFFICSLLCIASSPIIYQHVSVPCFFLLLLFLHFAPGSLPVEMHGSTRSVATNNHFANFIISLSCLALLRVNGSTNAFSSV